MFGGLVGYILFEAVRVEDMHSAAFQLDYVVVGLELSQADRALFGLNFFIYLYCAGVVMDVVLQLINLLLAD